MLTIHVRLDAPEIRGLYQLADAECRPLREQIRYIVRQALLQQGLLESVPADEQQAIGISDLEATGGTCDGRTYAPTR